MAVPTSNVGLSDIEAEFGGSTPTALSEYYAGAGLVPPGATAPGGSIPSSGEITIGIFRGAEAATTLQYIVVAGGGGGGADYGGGGGAGGYRSSVASESTGGGGTLESTLGVSPGTFPVTVG